MKTARSERMEAIEPAIASSSVTAVESDRQPAAAAPADKERAEKRGKVTAKLMTGPSFMAAHTAMSFIPDSMKAYGPANVYSMFDEFHKRVKDTCEGDMTTPEALLVAQAMSLNSIYNECAQLAGANIAKRLPQAEALMRMALKAQAQCTQTLRVLGELKAPKSVAFIKQQNNAAGNQQVNNGPVTQGTSARTSEESPERSNELLTD
ncbi:hypothetical protein BLA6993_05496 [Burkholderia lata]|uniref:hypothetical protein n=1 Tax=Burkholderia lata (strain ATCC 17760 / DSM 23089 / LMG 22485 / NCIMB 9086 / R18194 / 383) TaxID=482957 RepID=UPI001454B66E|nr:hypothetical protein [Burkholderia lata]VWC14064.1 hypothetical protein BLA6993_05496 [Burkholderia lata]